ncbi:PspC domain-containing protein [Candidatus Parabeggiatoa sp. HSG14]|uniref:PspC domain-containing protein n=1 Tax=Candidatus Parabeggiatoa sp. HSG14 TaxID=3055593 RepID=UPI0025A6EC34|nr:PspC domain-containing protein [Thiotrichales bacterium HSG14]
MTHSRRTLYKDEANGLLFGVCAGLARYFNLNVALIRLFFLMSFFLTWVIYVTLALILGNKPLDHTLTQSAHTLDTLEEQLQRIEQSIIRIEAYVISDEFELQRKLWELDRN